MPRTTTIEAVASWIGVAIRRSPAIDGRRSTSRRAWTIRILGVISGALVIAIGASLLWLINYLYPTLPDARTSGRDDLAAILLTGLDLRDVGGPINLNKTGSTLADMLRVNTAIKPNAAGACVFGVAGGRTPSRLAGGRPVRLPERPSPP